MRSTCLNNRLVLSTLPFLVSFFLGSVSPLISSYWEGRVRKYEEERGFHQTEISDNYRDFAKKATASIRMSTALIITSSSGLISIVINRGLSVFIFALLIFCSIVLLVWIDSKDPQYLATQTIGPYNYEGVFVMVINLLFIATIFLIEYGIL